MWEWNILSYFLFYFIEIIIQFLQEAILCSAVYVKRASGDCISVYIFHLMKFRDKCRCRRDDVICRVASLFAAFTITFKNQKIRDALCRASPAPPVIWEELSSPRSALRCRCPGDVGGSDSPVPAAAAAPRCPPRPPGGAGEQPTGAAAGAERGRAAARRGETPPGRMRCPSPCCIGGKKTGLCLPPPPPVCLEDALALFFLIYTQHVGCGEAGERPALTHRPCWRGYIKLLISLPDGKSLINRSQAH